MQKTDGISYDIKSGQDILDMDLLKKKVEKAAGIFHCAAKISIVESIKKPDEYYKTNVLGTENVIQAAERAGVKIVFSSSCSVYGDKDKVIQEASILNPKSPYAENKKDGEILLKNSRISHIALRYFNVYGPGQSKEYAGVITFFILNALKGEDLTIYGDGNQMRDFIYVDDVARANILAMNFDNDKFEVFNIGTGAPISINELAKKIIQLTNSPAKIIYKPALDGDIIYSNADAIKAKIILGWEPKISLEEGLQKTIEYYKKEL